MLSSLRGRADVGLPLDESIAAIPRLRARPQRAALCVANSQRRNPRFPVKIARARPVRDGVGRIAAHDLLLKKAVNPMQRFLSKVRRFSVCEDGPTAIEYAVMLSSIIACLSCGGWHDRRQDQDHVPERRQFNRQLVASKAAFPPTDARFARPDNPCSVRALSAPPRPRGRLESASRGQRTSSIAV